MNTIKRLLREFECTLSVCEYMCTCKLLYVGVRTRDILNTVHSMFAINNSKTYGDTNKYIFEQRVNNNILYINTVGIPRSNI